MKAAALCKKSKFGLFLSWIMRKKWNENELFYKIDEIGKEAHEAFFDYKRAVKDKKDVDGLSMARDFIVPGRVLFLRPEKSYREGIPNKKLIREFEAIWISGADLCQEGILLSTKMFTDHFPFISIETLEDIIKKHIDEDEDEGIENTV